MNDCRPVTWTSVAMKMFECIVLKYLNTASDGLMDRHQFAHHTNRSVDDAVDGCIDNADETIYRDGVQIMVGWCADNNLELNVSKTKK